MFYLKRSSKTCLLTAKDTSQASKEAQQGLKEAERRVFIIDQSVKLDCKRGTTSPDGKGDFTMECTHYSTP